MALEQSPGSKRALAWYQAGNWARMAQLGLVARREEWKGKEGRLAGNAVERGVWERRRGRSVSKESEGALDCILKKDAVN